MPLVLVVDDDLDARDALSQYLMRQGYEVESVPNGREALVSVLQRVPDVVVLDLFMAHMDGVNFLEVIRSYLRLQSLPVVVWTGAPDSSMIERARQLQVSATHIKPGATFDDIRASIEQILGPSPGGRPPSKPL